ncbi:hypothetical protein K505DRAFT_366660 [Melanomma pulvis-pyrius CBS 109.77]|uniref:Uncharacterized protein n=1 Tax=Melanomma pulvis-pyrius CBS 109.77 TaxID=1314802 RepID=A0A6A6WWB4_9PLEO|nr:hypothetical protein K505DRAFT_366660 [Melanomma pulvis-pyrius CBS 109.77]
MLTQDDFVVSNMSGERPLQRSSWKAEAIRKGNLKISGPIPITEETPLSEEEERRYAEKQSIEPLGPSSQPSEPQPHAPAPDETLPTSDAVEAQPQTQEEHHELRHKKSSTEMRATSETQRNLEHASRSAPSPFPSIPESTTKTPPRKKRKSGLRSAFRKMFGKRGRDESREDEDTTRRGHMHHASDPGLLTQSPKTKDTAGGPRISDLPVRELMPLNPLGQHLPFPMNVNAPQEASPPHEYLTFDLPHGDLSRRRATLPSVLHANAETQSLSGGKPLASMEERIDGELPSPQIGIALSSPSQGGQAHSIRSKRRSRSAGALRDLAKGRTSIERRRSAEIRYWRQSYQSGSIYSTNTPRPRTAQTVETVHTIDTQDYVAKAPESIAASSTVHAPTVDQHDQDISLIQLPVEAFNFGNLKSGFSDEEDHEDQPAERTRGDDRLSMEERVQHLEDNMRTMETSVNRISGRTNRQTIILENAPKGRRSRNRSSSGTSDRQSSHHSSKSSNVTLSASGRHSPSAPPSPVLAPLSSVSEFPQTQPPPAIAAELSATPPRAPTSYRSELATQFAAIYEALKHERSARKALEKQVGSLQREICDLHAIVNKLHTHSPSYPTPSPDAVITSSEERLSTPRASTRPDLHLGIDERGNRGTRETVLGRFDHDGMDRDESGSEWSSKEDITSPEAWATPKEESSGFFGKSRSRLDLKDGEDEMF